MNQQHQQDQYELQQAIDRLVKQKQTIGTSLENVQTCVLTLLKLIDAILSKPGDLKVRSIRLQNAKFQDKVGQIEGGIGILQQIGMEQVLKENEPHLMLLQANEDTGRILRVRTLLAQTARYELEIPPAQIPVLQLPNSNNNFDIYKGHRFDGKSAAIGQSVNAPSGYVSKTERELQQLQQKQQKLMKTTKIERNWVGFRPSHSIPNRPRPVEESSASSDKSMIAQHYQKQLQQQTARDNAGFTTKAMRDLEQLKKQKAYSTTVLLILFPDGHAVQGHFRPTEPIAQVIQSLQEDCLVAEYVNIPMELYQTPPRTVLKSSDTLLQAQLCPAAKVYVSWKTQAIPSGVLCLKSELFSTSNSNERDTSVFATGVSLVEPQQKQEPSKQQPPKKQPKKQNKEERLMAKMLGGLGRK